MDCFLTQNLRRCGSLAVLAGPCCGLLLLSACGGGGGGQESLQPVSSTVIGVAQKGPLLGQVPVHLYQLDSQGRRNGNSLSTVTDAQGGFSILIPWSGPTEVEASGRFYNELNAANSATTWRLGAIVHAGSNKAVNLNLFTTLVEARTRYLTTSGTAIAAAIGQATAELRAVFQLQVAATGGGQLLDLTDGSGPAAPDNANLLLFSAAVLSAGIGENAFIALADDFADDGMINGATLGDWLLVRIMATTFNLDNIGMNVQNLAWVADAPDFSDLNNVYPAWVDSIGDADADGLSDRSEVLLTFTDPLSNDTDNDLMTDAWETGNGLNPLFDDAGADADTDGLTNLAEFQNGTNPQLGDTDSDGYSDSLELAGGGDPLDNASLPLAFVTTPPLSVPATQNYTYAAGVTWPAAALTLNVQPAGMNIDAGGVVSWTPLLAEAGTYTVTVVASAPGYSVSQSFTLTVDPFNTGDINEDGFINAKDSLLAQRIALGLMSPSATEFNRADVRLDGVITAADAVIIERLALGL